MSLSISLSLLDNRRNDHDEAFALYVNNTATLECIHCPNNVSIFYSVSGVPIKYLLGHKMLIPTSSEIMVVML